VVEHSTATLSPLLSHFADAQQQCPSTSCTINVPYWTIRHVLKMLWPFSPKGSVPKHVNWCALHTYLKKFFIYISKCKKKKRCQLLNNFRRTSRPQILWRGLGWWGSWLGLELCRASTGLTTGEGALKRRRRNKLAMLDSHSHLILQQQGCAVTLGAATAMFRWALLAACTSSRQTRPRQLGSPPGSPHHLPLPLSLKPMLPVSSGWFQRILTSNWFSCLQLGETRAVLVCRQPPGSRVQKGSS